MSAPQGGPGGPSGSGKEPKKSIGVTFYRRTSMWQVQRRLDGVLSHFGAFSDFAEACVQHDIALIKRKGWRRAREMSINLDLGAHRDPRVLSLEGHEPTPEPSDDEGAYPGQSS